MERLNQLLDEYDALCKHGAPSTDEYNRLMRRLQRWIAAEASKMRATRYYALDGEGKTMAGPLSAEEAEELQRAGIPVEKRLRW